jgi:hypothetical protein
MVSKTESELKVIPRLLGVSPLTKLVAPGTIELGTTKRVKILSGEKGSNSAIWPDEASLRREVLRTEIPWRTGKDP